MDDTHLNLWREYFSRIAGSVDLRALRNTPWSAWWDRRVSQGSAAGGRGGSRSRCPGQWTGRGRGCGNRSKGWWQVGTREMQGQGQGARLDAVDEFLGLILGVVLEGRSPWRLVQSELREEDGGGGDHAGHVLHEPVLHQRELREVGRQELNLGVCLCSLEEAPKEALGGGRGQLKVQGCQQSPLHVEHFLPRVRVVRDVAELVHLRSVDLLVLGRNQHARDPHELQLAPHHLINGQVPIYAAHRQEEGVRDELVLLRHLHEPVHENPAHRGVDVALELIHVAHRRPPLHLLMPQVRVYLVDILGTHLRVVLGCCIHVLPGHLLVRLLRCILHHCLLGQEPAALRRSRLNRGSPGLEEHRCLRMRRWHGHSSSHPARDRRAGRALGGISRCLGLDGGPRGLVPGLVGHVGECRTPLCTRNAVPPLAVLILPALAPP
mmetsp:Transcript_23436/g.73458  ORF Transcript_23436/g.73458 Transcript_23436/m.73458 type:complete len:436 (-) Transcript_23436:260-1567(-)